VQGKSRITSFLHLLRMRFATPSVNSDLERACQNDCQKDCQKTAVGKRAIPQVIFKQQRTLVYNNVLSVYCEQD